LRQPKAGEPRVKVRELLQRWSETRARSLTAEEYPLKLDVDDAAKLHALAEMYPGVPVDEILRDLVAAALFAYAAETLTVPRKDFSFLAFIVRLTLRASETFSVLVRPALIVRVFSRPATRLLPSPIRLPVTAETASRALTRQRLLQVTLNFTEPFPDLGRTILGRRTAGGVGVGAGTTGTGTDVGVCAGGGAGGGVGVATASGAP
jgi:hypothetical protein